MTTIFDFNNRFNEIMVRKILAKYEHQEKLEGIGVSVDENTRMVTISNCNYLDYEELKVWLGSNGYPCQYL